MNETLDYLRTFAAFPFRLRRFMAAPAITLDAARRTVRDRMAKREANFLAVVERGVYGWPRSPYMALLKHAGCELGDLQALVRREGLEGALTQLHAAGVYVTFEEFKGRKPIERNGLSLPVTAHDFDNPFARRDYRTQTGGSTGRSTAVSQSLQHMENGAAHHLLLLATHNLMDVPAAVWVPIMPGGGLSFILRRASVRQPTERWYSTIGWRDSKYWAKYDLATLYMLLWMRVWGASAPWPQIVRHDQGLAVAQWLHATAQRRGRCLLYTSASQALRACVAAQEAGLDLTGVTLRVGGEPLTPAKAAAMRRTGARTLPTYGSVETGSMALGCAHPSDTDDTHVLTDALALITVPHPVEAAGVSVPAINVTTLFGTAPKLMLNMQTDDYGQLEVRSCGCELEACGFTTHLKEIRSYGKLVGEAVTLINSEMLRILEEVLPARFGGSSLDYQLMEQEDEAGFTRLYLVISPRLQIADEQAAVDTILGALSESSPMGDAARIVWQRAHTLQVKRMEPVATRRGKLLPLHIQGRSREY